MSAPSANTFLFCLFSLHLPPYIACSGNVAGIGWERMEGTPPPPGQAPKGRVYFTYCGQRLSPYLEDVAGGMWPLVHIQKKVNEQHLLQIDYYQFAV